MFILIYLTKCRLQVEDVVIACCSEIYTKNILYTCYYYYAAKTACNGVICNTACIYTSYLYIEEVSPCPCSCIPANTNIIVDPDQF